ncbi:MAG: sigma-70 family RNA polymerase sigma factor [Candidatus Omnitrophota bacterium]|nr:sigma-70 family RNA polymerase sigma factor [Candidatus Omnitrophota bacterium]MBU1929051.1 sigma-70 family RNA polymerase sigma factor [Candidatus Omnitrophota bacterium]MBU2034392.1 sigma-70 family RNA polymerase sigma factor [Candidatus Omnitrophota bacterium]MBU2221704.1 sigma-70 family RNA polymerase sigma factor [Candidatus Omnitrophota bacterium]MBU2258298.1 sigma-70 family RNA polymerase sigma factor [Candidatus Omnitrophota bacterium]
MDEISKEILKRASQGDIKAFEEIYGHTSDFVYTLAFKITRNISDAQEVCQDVFMKIYHGLNGFQFRSAFKTWVYRITVNTAINYYRKSARQSKDRLDYDGIIESIPDRRSTAEGAIKSDNEARFNGLVDKLIPEYKACLILREIEGLSYQEIATALKIPINTVRSRLKRARETLLEESGKGLMRDAV